ncbi:LysR family transcriptional regulator [Microbispora rosea subsp. aerata]|nr:LysR family transcriptional regulator [Microbispora rosea subsp. aerata]GIH57766.1 LysR family transcriptional regulator [Microbispora rosea subsp. aerata]GLJ84517.1 LysR family transcriptional regulator [Microbispora rosea subsp. aerata]
MVARTLSVTQAAKELHYAQSSVSDQILALERELGTELFDRTQRRLRLTPEGATLAEYAGRVFKLVEEARWAVAQPGDELVVGALETLCVHHMPEVLTWYRARYPHVRVRVGQGNRGELYDAVRRGDMELCLTFGDAPPDTALRSEKPAAEPLVVIVPPGHRLAERGEARFEELYGEPFLATERGCCFRKMFDGAFGTVLEPIAEVSSIGTLSACVAAGMGCALPPSLAVRAQADRREIAMVPVIDADLHTTTMTWLDRNSTKPTLVEFQKVLRARLGR